MWVWAHLCISVPLGVHGGEVRQASPQQLQLNVTLGILLPEVGVLVLKLPGGKWNTRQHTGDIGSTHRQHRKP